MSSTKPLAQLQKSDDVPPSYMPLKYTLMGSFLLLIIPILITMSVFDYLNAKNDLVYAYRMLQQQTESNIINAIKLVNSGYNMLDKLTNDDMKDAFVTFIDAYQMAGRDPSRMPLSDLKKQLGGKMDLYVISADGIVKYTTYTNDLGLDFKKWPDTFLFLTTVRNKNEFADGGFRTEARTGMIRKFAYMPTPDKKYVLELGLAHDQFAKWTGELDIEKITSRLKTLNPALNQVRIFSRHGHALGDQDYKPNAETMDIIKMVYETKTSEEIKDAERKRDTRYIFVNLKEEENISSDPSRVIELTYNTRLIDESLSRSASFHVLLSIISIVLSIIFTFIISAWITRPIQRIVKSVNIIAEGKLEHRIEVETNNELKLLKQSIIKMVNSMLLSINKIEQQNHKLTKLDKLKDDFLSNTSHELRTPINGIIGIAESMIEGATGSLPQKAIQNLSMIVFSGSRLFNLVNDILDFSKLKHQNIVLQIKPIEIKVVTDVIIILSQPLIGTKKIKLVNNIKEAIPVEADENRIQQILHNLVSNAIKFTESGVIEISSTTIENNKLLISINDTGIGIAPEKVDTVFNPFEQADGSISREYGGTGLGLSITKQLVELHGGDIRLHSTVGSGTTVSFTLPLSKTSQVPVSRDMTAMLERVPNLQALEISTEKEIVATRSPSEQVDESFHVLIVDDDPINLTVLENQLSLENYAITRAYNGKEALDAIRSGTDYAAILLDIMMPKMSGFEVCKIIRQTHPANLLPIIMLTAKNQVSDLVAGLQSGANDYLTKPFSKGELIARLKMHIQLSRINMALSQFVPMEFLHLLDKDSIIDVRLGDCMQKQMTVLFADIRSFTTLSESMSP